MKTIQYQTINNYKINLYKITKNINKYLPLMDFKKIWKYVDALMVING